jgi:O-antigen ligase
VAFVASLPVFLLMSRQRLRAALVAVPLALLAIGTIDMNPMLRGFETRGFNRWEAWADMLSLVEFFPVLGVGFNAFGSAYWPYQTFQRQEFWGEAHNEYLQILFDTGLVGIAIVSFLAARLVRAALASVGRGALRGGVFAALAASGVHALVSFNWQIPANAAAVAALCGLALHDTAADPLTEAANGVMGTRSGTQDFV